MSTKNRRRSFSGRGLPVPSAWDSPSNASRVSVFTFDDDAHTVEPLDASNRLLSRAEQAIAVRGRVASGFHRRKIALVTRFTAFGTETAETVELEADPLTTNSPRYNAAQ